MYLSQSAVFEIKVAIGLVIFGVLAAIIIWIVAATGAMVGSAEKPTSSYLKLALMGLIPIGLAVVFATFFLMR